MRGGKKADKTLEGSHFTSEQLDILKSKPWWIASTQTPYLVKFATIKSSILMKCTNLTHLYVKKFSQNEIKQDQQVYAKGLIVEGNQHMLNFFEGYLSERDNQAKYKFKQYPEEGYIDFKFEKQIEFFPFTWKFRLYKVECDIKKLICDEIINPLSFALERQTRRHQNLRRKSQQMEKDYIKRMTQTQKKIYKPLFIQTQEDWKILTKKDQNHYKPIGFEQQVLIPHVFDGFVSFAIKEFIKPFMPEKPKIPIQNLIQARNNNNNHLIPIVVEKSPNSKSRLPQIYNDEQQQVKTATKNFKEDDKKAKNNKKNGKNLNGIDFL